MGMNFAFAKDKNLDVTDIVSQSFQIKKQSESEQIDISQDGKGSNGVTILDAAGRRNVFMSCYTTDNGHRLLIFANNQNRTSRRCQSECYYRTSFGLDSVHRCNGVLGGNYNREFCAIYESGYTFQVTNAGAFDCQE